MNPMQFFRDFINRLLLESPPFFKVIQWVSIICMIVAGIPEMLAEFGIVLPIAMAASVNKIVGICAFVSFMIAKLTVLDPTQLPKPPSK